MNTLFERKILIIEDDASIYVPICDHFRISGCYCTVARTIAEGQAKLSELQFDAIVLDILLPDGYGTELFSSGRPLPPVIILSSLNEDEDILEGLSLGAADYVIKPCSPRVLEARLSLRLLPKNKAVITSHGLTLNLNMRTVSYLGKLVKLTSSEFNILYFLMTHPGKFFTADAIYENVWKASSMQTSVVRFHITNLRKTILSTTGKNLILTEFGMGYAFAKEEQV